ncbi:uncharacterized protein LOC129296278 [Prosopis cineraria]|uniref:uncharacterized protein LOC129296278 n=1 Tax=Prosopis cineraria TaxID=364024 RepID=UPI0024100271|nr:uncharacterized protein LOC129296278 [Prosopis cineraria]
MMMMMESPSRYGVVAVFAVSGSIAFLVHHLQKRLLSDFMRKLEFQISGNCEKGQGKKKKVRFAEKVIEVAAEVKEEEKGRKLEDVMPPNRAALYRGIIKHRTFHAQLRF